MTLPHLLPAEEVDAGGRVMVLQMDRLSADDRLVLWPDAVWPQDVGAVAILDAGPLLDARGELRLRAVQEAVQRRLHLLPRFRQVLHEPRRGLGGPVWVDAPAFDIRDHVRALQVPPPAGQAQLWAAVERIRRRRLDRGRPLWELWLLMGLPGGRVGMFFRLHHVVADGMAGIVAVAALLDSQPDAPVPEPKPWSPTPGPAPRQLLFDNVRLRAAAAARALGQLTHPRRLLVRAMQAWPSLRELLAQPPGPQTSLHRLIGPGRAFAVARTDLAEVIEIGHAHGATVNDVLLAATAGGLARLLSSRGEPLDGLALPVYVPVSLRLRGRGGDGGNLITQMVVALPLDEPDPLRRLRGISTETQRQKAMARPPLGALFRSKVLAALLLRLVARQRVSVVTADLPGPQEPLYFAGAEVLEVFPMVNLIGTVSLGVGALSYAGHLDVLAVADEAGYPDLDVFVAGFEQTLRVLASFLPTEEELGPSVAKHPPSRV